MASLPAIPTPRKGDPNGNYDFLAAIHQLLTQHGLAGAKQNIPSQMAERLPLAGGTMTGDVLGLATDKAGITIGDGVAEDIDLLLVNEGSPTLPKALWAESENAFSLTRGLRITAGKVCIGAVSPNQMLHIVKDDDSNPVYVKVQNVDGTVNAQAGILLATSSNENQDDIGAAILADRTNDGGAGSTDLLLRNSLAAAMNTNLRLKANRDVEIVAGNLIIAGLVDGRDVAVDGAKLDGIDAFLDQAVLTTSNVQHNSIGLGVAAPGSGNLLLANNNEIQFKDSGGAARASYRLTAADVLEILNNSGGSGGVIVFRNKSGAGESARIDSSGRFGLGKTPAKLMDVDGSDVGHLVDFNNSSTGTNSDVLRLSLGRNGANTNNYWVMCYDNGFGNTLKGGLRGDGTGSIELHQVSDERRKEIIGEMPDMLEKVLQIRTIAYRSKGVFEGKYGYGFSAQQLQRIDERFASGDPNGDVDKEPMGLEYGKFTPILTKAIQEVAAQVTANSADIGKMALEITEMRKRITELEAGKQAVEEV